MKHAVIEVRAHADAGEMLDRMGREFIAAWNDPKGSEPSATFTFSSPSQLFSVISPKRWELIERLQALGPSSIRGLARALDRDVKRVHEDVAALCDWGIIERTEGNKVCVPFDVIHAGFDLRAVA